MALGRPDLELDHRNLVTLCAESAASGAGDHHLLIGHLDDYESMTLRARREAEHQLHGMTAAQLRANETWQLLMRHRPPHLAEMLAVDRKALRATMDAAFPER